MSAASDLVPCIVTDGGGKDADIVAFPSRAERDAELAAHGAPGHYAAAFTPAELVAEEFASCIHHPGGPYRPWACAACRISLPEDPGARSGGQAASSSPPVGGGLGVDGCTCPEAQRRTDVQAFDNGARRYLTRCRRCHGFVGEVVRDPKEVADDEPRGVHWT